LARSDPDRLAKGRRSSKRIRKRTWAAVGGAGCSTLSEERRSVMVMNIALSDSEVKLLLELLQGDMSRLLLEIAHTDHRSMKLGLKEREEVLRHVIQKLEVKG
jgi:hypothetical protein